jgi:hypothetical protein
LAFLGLDAAQPSVARNKTRRAPDTEVRVLEGGNAAWFTAGKPEESGIERATTTRDDVWYKPYDHASGFEKHAREYLEWEVALVEQIKRDPTIRFRAYG